MQSGITQRENCAGERERAWPGNRTGLQHQELLRGLSLEKRELRGALLALHNSLIRVESWRRWALLPGIRDTEGMASGLARGASGWTLGGIGQHQFWEQMVSSRGAEPRCISQIVVQPKKGLGEEPEPTTQCLQRPCQSPLVFTADQKNQTSDRS